MLSNAVRTLLLASLALAGACGVLDPEPWDDRRDALEYSRAVWDGTGIQDYEYRLQRSCFCPLFGELQVTVVDDSVVQAVRPDGTPVPEEELPYVETVADLFDIIEWAIRTEAYSYQVAYHPTLGYPVLVDLDPIRNAVDDELRLEARDLQSWQVWGSMEGR